MEPNIQTWYQKHMSFPFDFKSFYRLLDLILYMGVVCIPCKADYWKCDNIFPYHTVMHKIGMIQDHFSLLWIPFTI